MSTVLTEAPLGHPSLMTPARGVMFRRRKKTEGAPPPPIETVKTIQGPPKCDNCHVADAAFEIIISAEKFLRFFLCRHHAEKHWQELVSRGYQIKLL
jgi:hypothetical protein